MKLIETNDGFMIERAPCEYLEDAQGNNLFATKTEAKRAAAHHKIEQAQQNVQRALNCNLAGYIVRARRNALAVACSDAALLEAHIILESQ